MFKRLLLILYLLSQTVGIASEQSITDFSKNLPELQSISCKFTQERTFSTQKVKSSGNFKYVKGKGAYFLTTYPVKSTSAYTSANNKYINDIILAVSKKNFSKIEKDFDLKFLKSPKSPDWNVYMSAKNQEIKNHINYIKIFGDDKHITEIQLNQVNPSIQTDIKFQFGD